MAYFKCRRPVFTAQPSAEEARHEAIAGTQHVEDFDGEAFAAFAIVETAWNVAWEDHCAHRSALADERGVGNSPHGAQRFQSIGGATGDVELFLGADDQVEEVESGLQLLRDLRRFHEAAFTVTMTSHTPEVRAVVDVERSLRAAVARQAQRLQNRRFRARMRKMRAGSANAVRFGDESRVDIVFAQRHIGAVLAIEDQGELLLVADAENDECGQALLVGLHAANIDALTHQLFADEAPHVLVADAGNDGTLQTKPCGTCCNVGRRATDVFVEGGHVLQTSADLRAVKIDRRTADRDEIECLHDLSPPRCYAPQRTELYVRHFSPSFIFGL
ncbi:hypothetical protein QE408_001117 [Agrobacterium larrymoorei]|uniref:Uncharacterized protein n=1 Tax=Agrobacterium larrymoorei TaxID=160699 RepID=A0ABU0UGC1_9HYPH|nr:hypothetical protein [Agrobacterium larrymoorei]